MDEAISAIFGAIIFTAFVGGLAESIGTIPFYLIVILVVVLMGYEAYEEVQKGWSAYKRGKDSK